MAFIDARAEIVDGILAAGDQSEHLEMLLHYKIIIRMDSDEEKNNEMGIY